MGRLPDIDPAKLSSEQRIIYDQIMRARGHMRGPFAVWLRNAELCENTLKLQEMFASRVKLERRLLELMILVAARSATAQYAWYIHEPHALKFGIAPEIVQAIRERRTPEFTRDDERWSTTSRWNSTPPERYPRQEYNAAWQCSANKSWSSWSARSAST